MGFYRRLRGFARLAGFLASLVAFWPVAVLELWLAGYGLRGLVYRIGQEIALARGADERELREACLRDGYA